MPIAYCLAYIYIYIYVIYIIYKIYIYTEINKNPLNF